MQNRRERPRTRDVDRHLPLRPAACAVLAALADAPRPGIDVLEAVNATVPGKPLLGPGTLYRLIARLLEEGLITETPAPTRADRDDVRRKYYALTPRGRQVLTAEVGRLEHLLAGLRLTGRRGRGK